LKVRRKVARGKRSNGGSGKYLTLGEFVPAKALEALYTTLFRAYTHERKQLSDAHRHVYEVWWGCKDVSQEF
jgi:hypothetical protein